MNYCFNPKFKFKICSTFFFFNGNKSTAHEFKNTWSTKIRAMRTLKPHNTTCHTGYITQKLHAQFTWQSTLFWMTSTSHNEVETSEYKWKIIVEHLILLGDDPPNADRIGDPGCDDKTLRDVNHHITTGNILTMATCLKIWIDYWLIIS